MDFFFILLQFSGLLIVFSEVIKLSKGKRIFEGTSSLEISLFPPYKIRLSVHISGPLLRGNFSGGYLRGLGCYSVVLGRYTGCVLLWYSLALKCKLLCYE